MLFARLVPPADRRQTATEKKGDRCDAPRASGIGRAYPAGAAAERREAWCSLVPIDQRTWAIRGSIAYEGEVILAEFDTREVAELALEWLVTAEGSSYTR